jgi:hypothetical protein
MSSESELVTLGQMPQQVGIRTQKDDWTGIVDRAERRKLQNRLNQRAFRMEKITATWFFIGKFATKCDRFTIIT